MMKTLCELVTRGLVVVAISLVCTAALAHSANAQSSPTIFETTLEEPNQLTPEISTEQLQQILANDASRSWTCALHWSMRSHTHPRSDQHSGAGGGKIMELYPHGDTKMILTCNGPFCGRANGPRSNLLPTDM